MDVLDRDKLPFPKSLPEFQRLFPDDGACAAWLEKARWPDGSACPRCGVVGDPFRFTTRPVILMCRSCRRQTGLMVGTAMERSHIPLSVWFWAAYLVASQTTGIFAVQLQRQLGLTRYETAFGLLLAAADQRAPPINAPELKICGVLVDIFLSPVSIFFHIIDAKEALNKSYLLTPLAAVALAV